MASQPIYQFYAVLRDCKPKIWRRFQVLSNITMPRLGYILMTMYEMEAQHLFRITVPVLKNAKLQYPDAKFDLTQLYPEEYWEFSVTDLDDFDLPDFPGVPKVRKHSASGCRLDHILNGQVGEKLVMEYDYGDGWEIDVALEAVIIDKELSGRELPRVLEGKGFGIVENCGGPGGLEQLAEAFRRKRGPEYEEYREWLGCDDFDLTAFNAEDINFRLKKIPRIYRDIYEYDIPPTQRSIALLERKYLK